MDDLNCINPAQLTFSFTNTGGCALDLQINTWALLAVTQPDISPSPSPVSPSVSPVEAALFLLYGCMEARKDVGWGFGEQIQAIHSHKDGAVFKNGCFFCFFFGVME